MAATDYELNITQKYRSEVGIVHVLNIDQYLKSLDLFKVPDPIKKGSKATNVCRMVHQSNQECRTIKCQGENRNSTHTVCSGTHSRLC